MRQERKAKAKPGEAMEAQLCNFISTLRAIGRHDWNLSKGIMCSVLRFRWHGWWNEGHQAGDRVPVRKPLSDSDHVNREEGADMRGI